MAITIDGTTGITMPAGGLANTTGAAVGTSDTQTLTNKTLTTPNIDSAQFATVSGNAPLYACRAWVNFNGTGTVAIRASGNVSSITDNGTGVYTVNFVTAMSDTNYILSGVAVNGSIQHQNPFNITTSGVQIVVVNRTTGAVDSDNIGVSVFR